MQKEKKSLTRTAIFVAILLAIAFVLREIYEDLPNAMLQAVMVTVRNTIHISLLFAWIVSVHRRMVNKNLRRLMLIVGCLLLFWLVDKIVKWDFTGSLTHPLVRYLWYGFYVGMLFVPTLGAFIINYLGKPENYSHPKKLNYLLIPPTILLTTVFTNDLHQKVFVFYNGFINFDLEYSYDWAYWLNMGWFIGMGFYFVVMMLLKSRVPSSRKLQKMPVAIMAFAALFWIGYSLRLYNCDITVMDCLIIILLLESAIQSGLLPSNTRYGEVFDSTTVPVQIVDRDYQPHYVSGAALPVSEAQMRQSAHSTVDLGDSLLSSAPIQAGRVVWQDDIRPLNDLRTRLRDAVEQLGEENTLLQAELELKENRAKADEQNRLYDRITREVEPQLIQADELLRRIEEGTEDSRNLIAKVCVLGSYIKRRGNLLLLGEAAGLIHTRELEYCIRESMDNLNLSGVFTSFNSRCEGDMQLTSIVSAYDFYELLVERLLDSMTAMMVNLTCGKGHISMNIQMGCREEIAQQVLQDISLSHGSFRYEIMEEDVVIDLTIIDGGGEGC
ncbi:MAG: hypothetical protein IKM59_04640 [Oscillospiraceae bacterium]|nr:hypothetical protein [Oscillospiraceae bacterium]